MYDGGIVSRRKFVDTLPLPPAQAATTCTSGVPAAVHARSSTGASVVSDAAPGALGSHNLRAPFLIAALSQPADAGSVSALDELCGSARSSGSSSSSAISSLASRLTFVRSPASHMHENLELSGQLQPIDTHSSGGMLPVRAREADEPLISFVSPTSARLPASPVQPTSDHAGAAPASGAAISGGDQAVASRSPLSAASPLSRSPTTHHLHTVSSAAKALPARSAASTPAAALPVPAATPKSAATRSLKSVVHAVIAVSPRRPAPAVATEQTAAPSASPPPTTTTAAAPTTASSTSALATIRSADATERAGASAAARFGTGDTAPALRVERAAVPRLALPTTTSKHTAHASTSATVGTVFRPPGVRQSAPNSGLPSSAGPAATHRMSTHTSVATRPHALASASTATGGKVHHASPSIGSSAAHSVVARVDSRTVATARPAATTAAVPVPRLHRPQTSVSSAPSSASNVSGSHTSVPSTAGGRAFGGGAAFRKPAAAFSATRPTVTAGAGALTSAAGSHGPGARGAVSKPPARVLPHDAAGSTSAGGPGRSLAHSST